MFIYFYLYLLSLLLLLLLTSRISPKGWDCSESNFPLIKKKTEKLLKIAQALYSVYSGSILSPFYVCRKNGDPSLPDYKASWMFGLVRKCADWRINIYTAMVPGPTPSNLPATTWKPTSSEMSLSVSLQRSA